MYTKRQMIQDPRFWKDTEAFSNPFRNQFF